MEQLAASYHSKTARAPRGLRALLQPHAGKRPARGMAVSFRHAASKSLGGIPARVTDIWPRLASGDYLVTLEYAEPVKFRNVFITHIEAFMSDLEPSSTPAI